MKHLPVIPDRFDLQPIERNEARYKLLVRLLKKKDVDTVVNACDAGREGELIFHYVLQLANLSKKLTVKRMWMQSMTDGSILQAWDELRAEGRNEKPGRCGHVSFRKRLADRTERDSCTDRVQFPTRRL